MICIAVAFIFQACAPQKEPVAPKDKHNSNKLFDPYAAIIKQDGMLKFQSSTHLRQVLAALEQEDDNWNDAFEAQWGYLSDSLYNAKAEELNFNEDQALINFENRFTLTSLRARISTAEDVWLDTPNASESADPDLKTTVDDDIFRALINTNGEFRIGDSIFVEKPYMFRSRIPDHHCLIVIPNGSQTVLNWVRQKSYISYLDFDARGPGYLIGKAIFLGSTQLDFNTSVAKGGETSTDKSGDCIGWRRKHIFERYENNQKRYKVVASIRNYGAFTKGTGKTVSYKKKSNGGWKKYRTSIGVSIEGTWNLYDCTTQLPITSKYKNKKRRRVRVDVSDGGSLKLKTPYEIATFHACKDQFKSWGVFW